MTRGKGAWLLAAALAVPSAALAADEEARDDWFVQFHNGKKAGWSHLRRARATEGGKPVWVTETESSASLDGSAEGPRLLSTGRVVEDESGRVLSYRTSVDIGMQSGPQVREGVLKGDAIHAVEDGKARQVPYPKGALGPAAVDRAITRKLEPGTEGEVLAFQPIDGSGAPLRWKVAKSTEITDVLGRHLWLTRVEKTGDDGMPEVSLLGPGRREFAGSNNLGLWQWLLTEEVVAKAEVDPAALLRPAVVEPDRAIPGSPKPGRARFRLSRKGRPLGELPEGAWQKVVARAADGSSAEVEVNFVEPASGTAIARPQAPKPETAKYLAATPLLELEHPRLKQFSADVVGGLINSLRTSRMIELAVKEYVRPARAGTGFQTACEAISSAQGDSGAAAALAAGLARAAGVPSRLVAGFVYWDASTWGDAPRPKGAFALHFWIEVHVADGVWFPLDPMRMDGTRPEKGVDELEGHGGFDATHVAVLVSDLSTARPFTDIAKPVLDFMDGLSIEVLEPK
ncbi:MAG TPA: transglutaminase domain-containing protein [Planctomycetota bacterium]|nr:transglutaminase domain-containing protein [Planctomycetota bacterium]